MNFKCIFTVLKKELKDMIRDKKTIIVGIIIPLMMFPIMFGILGKSTQYKTDKVTNNLKIAIESEDNNTLINNLKNKPNIKICESKDMKQDLIDGNIYCGIVIENNFESNLLKDEQPKINIIYDNSSQDSQIAMQTVKSYIEEYSKEISEEKLKSKGLDISILNPIEISNETIIKDKNKNGMSTLILSLILPLILMLYSISSTIPSAVDLGAGEKERGTLEPLLTTNASRIQLFLGKLLAISIMGIVGTISSIVGLIIAFNISGNMFGENFTISITTKMILLMFIIVFMLVLVSSAIELSISVYARSFKEAQTYLTPASFIAIIVCYGTYAIDIKSVSNTLFNIPLVNTVLILREIINEIYNPMHIVITIVWEMIYVILALILARYMFNKEDVIFRI